MRFQWFRLVYFHLCLSIVFGELKKELHTRILEFSELPFIQMKQYEYTIGVDSKMSDWRAPKLDDSLIHIPSRKKTITLPVCLDCLSLSTRPCSFNKLQLIVINSLD